MLATSFTTRTVIFDAQGSDPDKFWPELIYCYSELWFTLKITARHTLKVQAIYSDIQSRDTITDWEPLFSSNRVFPTVDKSSIEVF